MKTKILLLLVYVLFSQLVYSQITKSYWLLGGSGSYQSSNYDAVGADRPRQIFLQVTADVGYFVVDKLALGVKPGFIKTKTTPPKSVANTYLFGPFARYYFLSPEKVVNLFVELGYQFGRSKSNNGYSQNNSEMFGNGGLAAFLNTSVALELTLGYSSLSYNNNATGKIKSVIAGVGFHYHFQKDKKL